jgi:hypothetical protein
MKYCHERTQSVRALPLKRFEYLHTQMFPGVAAHRFGSDDAFHMHIRLAAQISVGLREIGAVEDSEDRSLLGMLGQALGKSKDNFTFDTGPIETAESAEPTTKRRDEVPVDVEQLERTSATQQTLPLTRLKLPESKVRELLLEGLMQLPDFPRRGVKVTVYGSNPWNAMLDFAPGSTSHKNAITCREALTEIVDKLRPIVEVDLDGIE